MRNGIFAGGGPIGELARAFDWSQTALGPVETWPQSLKTSVSICLNSRFAIVIWWGKELVTLYNEGYAKILGNKHPDALGIGARELWPEIWHIIGPMLEGVMERGEATWSDNLLLVLERNGYPEEGYFTFSYSPVRDESGGVGGVITPVQETTSQVIGERRLRTLRDLADAARAANAQSGEEVCRLAGQTLAHNPWDVPFAAFYLFSADGDEAHLAGSSGVPSGSHLIPERVRIRESALEWPFAGAVQSGKTEVVPLPAALAEVPRGAWPVPPEQVLVMPVSPVGQRTGFAVLAVNPRKRLDEEYRGFLSLIGGHVTTAIAEARAWEEERKRAQALAELDRAKTAFFSNVSHEFRTPLTLMLGPLEEILTLNKTLPAHVAELARVTHRNGLRLQRLVNTLLDFSRIEAGRGRASYEPTELGTFTAELASVFRSTMERAGLRFTVACAPLAEPVHVDREMWEKVVLNLLSNAFKYTFEGTVTVTLREQDRRAVLTVEDTGTGIPERDLPHIFERFHRVEGARGRTQEGTGIGLALVAELINLHGGSIEARSTLGKGSTFTVSLPFGTAHVSREHTVAARKNASTARQAESYVDEAARWFPQERSVAAGAGSFTGQHAGTSLAPPARGRVSAGRVIVADDNADMRDYVARLLAGSYEVETAANGEQALASVLDRPPDLLLSDVMMPGIDGFGLVQTLRRRAETSALPVILLSARAGEEARVEGLQGGASDYLVKPFTARELLARVGAQIEMARLRKQAAAREAELRADAEAARDQAEMVLESITDAFITFDAEWRFIYVNKECERLLGMRREEMLGYAIWDLFPATLGTIVEREYRRAVREQVPVDFEYFHEPWNRWFAIRGYPTRDGGLSNYFRDITAGKQAQAALREQDALREADRRRWRELFFKVPAAVAILRGPDHVFDHVNAEYQRTVGRSASQLLGKPMRDVFPELNHQGYIQQLDSVYRTGTSCAAKEVLFRLNVREDGVLQDVYANCVYNATRDDAGRVDGVFVHAVVVTDLVMARKRIEETNQRLTLALAAARGLVYELDYRSGHVTREPGLEELTGWKSDEAQANRQWWLAKIHPDDRERVVGWKERVAADQTMRVLIYRFRHRNGDWRWVEDHALIHRDEAGEISRIIGIAIDVTVREQVQEELRQNRERFQTAVRAVSDLVWTNNAKGEMEGDQPGWGGFTGQSYEEYQGYGWAKAVHPEDAQPTIDAWNQAVAERKMFVFEHRVRRHDGVWRLFSIRALPILDAAGAVREWVGVHTDITDRRRAEEELRQSEERFRQLAESMPQIVWTGTPEGVCDYVNARWTEATGCDLAATQAGAYLRGMLPEDLAIFEGTITEGLRTGQPYSFECRFPSVSGELRWYLVRSIPVRNAKGEIIKWLGTSTDIDEQKRAAEALRLSEWRLRFTLDAARFGSFELNLRTLEAECSPLCDTIFGYENPRRWTYAGFLDHVLPEYRPDVERHVQKSLGGEGDANFECRIRRASDGAIRWIWSYGKIAAGAPGLMLGLVRDITERKEAEAALLEANEELRQANADLEQFGYSASHDLQEPLRNVTIYSELLVRDYSAKLDGKALQMLGYLSGGASRMQSMIRDLMAYTQVKKLQVVEDSDSMQAMADALANLANAITESGAKIEYGALPPVRIHKVYLQQLLQNLIGNALKYRSEEPPLIRVAAEKREREWLFSVSDNGIGIGADYHEQIFGLFKRLHGARYPGTGIGLAICKRTIERYGGRMWVASEPGKGSTFYFTVPL